MNGVIPPKQGTLNRYGLSKKEWRQMLQDQGGVCYVCKKVPNSRRLCIDHDHVFGWKRLPPDLRKRYVRGLLCWFCNHYYLARGITPAKAHRVWEYLVAYETRKTASGAAG